MSNKRFVRSGFWVLLLSTNGASQLQIPHIDIRLPGGGKASWTPFGPVPTPVLEEANKSLGSVSKAAMRAGSTVAANVVAQPGHVIGVIAGQESLGDAAKNIIQGHGKAIQSVGKAIQIANGVQNRLKIVAAQSIGGNVGKTVMTLGTGPERLEIDFAATIAIQAGSIVSGKARVEDLLAAPLAAAIRAAEAQFDPDSRPLPGDVKEKLRPYYAPEILESAHWAIGSISLSLPDVVNQTMKAIEGLDNAVTVGHVTVFARDPGNNYHWWAHELQHQVQYHEWRLDDFAFKYVTSCHEVESNAEDKAQQAIPILGKVSLGC